MNNDELQKAIDDITKDNASAEAAVAPATENEQLADEAVEQAATPAAEDTVTPAAVPEVDLGTAPAPAVPAEPSMPPVAEIETAPVTEPAPVLETAVAPVVETAPASDNATLEEAMKELYPLLDRVDMPVEEKFDITIKYGEPAKALDLAKQFTDETAKANALLQIIDKVK